MKTSKNQSKQFLTTKPMKKKCLSNTQIKMMLSCPRQYAYAYIEKAEKRERDTTKMDMGSLLHLAVIYPDIFEYISQYLDFNEEDKALIDGVIDSQPNDVWKYGDRSVQLKGEEQTKMIGLGFNEKYPLEAVAIARKLPHDKIKTVKFWFNILTTSKLYKCFQIKEHDVNIFCDIDEHYSLFSKLDAVCGDGIIIDWKTGQINPDNEIQHNTYFYSYYKKYGELPREFLYVQIKTSGIKVFSITPLKHHFYTFFNCIKKFHEEMNKKEFPAKPERLKCKFCDFNHICPNSLT